MTEALSLAERLEKIAPDQLDAERERLVRACAKALRQMAAPGWPEIEIRNNDDGSLDEIVMRVGGECVYHLEQMSHRSWWMGCYQGKKRVAVWLMAQGKITAMIEDDTAAPSAPTGETE